MTQKIPDWQEPLQKALNQGQPQDRFATFATVDAEGCPQARTVVVRSFEGGVEPRLTFTADLRSAKVTELSAEPRAMLCWYLTQERLQFRLSVRAKVEADPTERHIRWNALAPTMQAGFAAGRPGEGIDTQRPEPVDSKEQSTELPPEHFGVISLNVYQVDLLDLTAPTLRRYAWHPTPQGWHGQELWP